MDTEFVTSIPNLKPDSKVFEVAQPIQPYLVPVIVVASVLIL